MKKVVILLLVCAFGFSVAFLGSPEQVKAADKEPIKIGSILNLTGPIAFIGPLFKNGIVKALE